MTDTKRADAVEAAIRAAVRAEGDDAAELACELANATLARIETLTLRPGARDDDDETTLYFLRLDVALWKREAIRTTFPDKALDLCVRIGRAASWLESVDVLGIVAEFAANRAEVPA